MDAKESFSDGDEAAGDLIEEVYDYMTRKRYPKVKVLHILFKFRLWRSGMCASSGEVPGAW